MRARMSLMISQQKVELREIILRDKPAAMIAASPKATVPVLILPSGTVIEESLDIIYWALGQNDPQNWLAYKMQTNELIAQCDGPFKTALDRYKYYTRYDDADPQVEREKAWAILLQWNEIIGEKLSFFENYSLADYAIFPFVRQFAAHDRAWFDAQPIPHVQHWLNHHLNSALFKNIMPKYPIWQEGDAITIFPA